MPYSFHISDTEPMLSEINKIDIKMFWESIANNREPASAVDRTSLPTILAGEVWVKLACWLRECMVWHDQTSRICRPAVYMFYYYNWDGPTLSTEQTIHHHQHHPAPPLLLPTSDWPLVKTTVHGHCPIPFWTFECSQNLLAILCIVCDWFGNALRGFYFQLNEWQFSPEGCIWNWFIFLYNACQCVKRYFICGGAYE